MSILRILGFEPGRTTEGPSSPETETVRKISAALDDLDPDQAKYIACFAYILSRVARADLSVSHAETRMMERIIMERARLPEEQAVLVVQMAKTQNKLFGGTENYLVTREFHKLASRDQKLSLLDCLFAVSAADRSISTIESNEISQIAQELKIDHKDYISIRSTYRDYLAVLQDQPAEEDPEPR